MNGGARGVNSAPVHPLPAQEARVGAAIARTPTRRLEVEPPQLDGVGGVVQRQLLVVGQAAFPRLRLGSFSAQQSKRRN